MNEKLKKKISGKGFFVLGDRLLAIIVVVAVSGISFSLGYFVGGATGRGTGQLSEAPARVVEPLSPPDIQPVIPQPQTAPVAQPQIVIINDTQAESQQAQVANELAALPPDEEASPAPVMKPRSAKAADKKTAAMEPATREQANRAAVLKIAESKSAMYFTVQVGAFKTQADADALKKKIAGKGYSAFVQKSGAKADTVPYKVRVGSFKEKKDAESMSVKLGKAENIKGFVTRKD